MRGRAFLLLLILVAGCVEKPGDTTRTADSARPSAPAPQDRRFDVRSGIFERVTKIANETGTREDRHRVYFDEYGGRVIWFTEARMPNDTARTALMLDRGELLSFSPESGDRVPIGPAAENRRLIPAFLDPETTSRMRLGYGYTMEEIGQEDILGRPAIGYRWTSPQAGTIEEWVWNRISLRFQAPGVSDEVTRLETDIPIPAEKFRSVTREDLARELAF